MTGKTHHVKTLCSNVTHLCNRNITDFYFMLHLS